jgi:hypothetical protein
VLEPFARSRESGVRWKSVILEDECELNNVKSKSTGRRALAVLAE